MVRPQKMYILWGRTIEMSPVKFFQRLRGYGMYQELVQTDQVNQSHQLPTDLDTYKWRYWLYCKKSPFLLPQKNPHVQKKCKVVFFNKFLFEVEDRIWRASGDFFLGGPNEGIFALWSISSHVGVQICRELVRLITLIGLNKFLIHIISPKPLKKISRTTSVDFKSVVSICKLTPLFDVWPSISNKIH